MQFPAKIMKGHRITIPKDWMEHANLEIGDMVMVDITPEKAKESMKQKVESTWNDRRTD